jgi:hypothetical protein
VERLKQADRAGGIAAAVVDAAALAAEASVQEQLLHDLGNALSIVAGAVGLEIAEAALSGRTSECLGMARDGTEAALALLRDLRHRARQPAVHHDRGARRR